MKCPQCQAEAKKVGQFWICPTHGQLPEANLFTPLRIFLSYGHDGNEELVRHIKADLEKRGHDVWFDKSEIKAGDDWRRSITEGIARSDKFVSFRSKHSTRDPGVCRDEIAIAIGMKGGNILRNDSRLFWIMGAPGVGKSAFAAQLTHTRGDTVIAAQFCEWDKPDHRNAPRVVRSLAFQLATRLPDYRKLLLTLPEIAELDRKDAAELFAYLLANPLRSVINGGRERYLIVIDALDEAGEAGRNPLVEMPARNAQRLPDWTAHAPVFGTN